MNRLYFIFAFIFIVAISASAQEKPIRIVFDITSADDGTHQSAIRHLQLMTDAYPNAQFELVSYGKSLPMLLPEKSTVAPEISALLAKPNVNFYVCEMTLKKYGKTKADLIPGVGTVPDGIMEIVMKQNDGWAYIKEAHQ
ncbi:DsrE family protein [Fulvivirga sedimenti]|uniref:DsrE family protein n=1 Tax=Fulvivirga sedimenti TaxID=2879465 RepID=A0A9X1HKY0_9BACT|nr:DsrE family protein [Fulvivirga sedimenti]MCA6073905.1 DsrE family protein [Fulvivirga sedimenti]